MLRFEGIDAETALEKINRKFKKRFEFIEANTTIPFEEMHLKEMEILREKAKTEG